MENGKTTNYFTHFIKWFIGFFGLNILLFFLFKLFGSKSSIIAFVLAAVMSGYLSLYFESIKKIIYIVITGDKGSSNPNSFDYKMAQHASIFWQGKDQKTTIKYYLRIIFIQIMVVVLVILIGFIILFLTLGCDIKGKNCTKISGKEFWQANW